MTKIIVGRSRIGAEGLSVAKIEEQRLIRSYVEEHNAISPRNVQLSETELKQIFPEGHDFIAIAQTLAAM